MGNKLSLSATISPDVDRAHEYLDLWHVRRLSGSSVPRAV